MKSFIVLSALLLSSVSYAADCGRVEGTPGFQGENADRLIAKAEAMSKCDTYRYYSSVEGSCSFMGCGETQGVYTCNAIISVCR